VDGLAAAAGVRYSRKEFDRVIADYSEAIWLDPLAITADHSLGLAWHAKKEYDKAIIDYNLVIRLDPQNVPALNACALAWKAMKSYRKALADCDEAIRIDHEEPTAYNSRAWIWATCPDQTYRDGSKAVASATKACELTRWKNGTYLATLVAACAETEDFASAVKWQTRANAIGFDLEEKTNGQARLELYQAKQPYRESNPLNGDRRPG
jgi:tetratricopeptide (TPR) repeat protein